MLDRMERREKTYLPSVEPDDVEEDADDGEAVELPSEEADLLSLAGFSSPCAEPARPPPEGER